MVDGVREMGEADPTFTSVYRMKLPFRVDPTEKKIVFVGTSSGARLVHVDLAERKRVTKMSLHIMDRAKCSNPCPEDKKIDYSNLES